MPNNTQQTNNDIPTTFSREQSEFLFDIANKIVEKFKLVPLERDNDYYLDYVIKFMDDITNLVTDREPSTINMDVHRHAINRMMGLQE
jgi:hypothetical protein